MNDLGVWLVFYGLLALLGAAGWLMVAYGRDELRRTDTRRLR